MNLLFLFLTNDTFLTKEGFDQGYIGDLFGNQSSVIYEVFRGVFPGRFAT